MHFDSKKFHTWPKTCTEITKSIHSSIQANTSKMYWRYFPYTKLNWIKFSYDILGIMFYITLFVIAWKLFNETMKALNEKKRKNKLILKQANSIRTMCTVHTVKHSEWKKKGKLLPDCTADSDKLIIQPRTTQMCFKVSYHTVSRFVIFFRHFNGLIYTVQRKRFYKK